MSALPRHKTRIVCTIGPASKSPRILERMIRAGLSVARLNLAHGDFDSHKAIIMSVRTAADRVGRRVTLLADLPGPKLRVGGLSVEVVELKRGQLVRLVGLDMSRKLLPAASRSGISLDIPITLPAIPPSLKEGDDIFLNDGLIQLRVQRIVDEATTLTESEITDGSAAPLSANAAPDRVALARVVVGGELRSRDGISLPGIDLGISAFTEQDRELLSFALAEGVEAVGRLVRAGSRRHFRR